MNCDQFTVMMGLVAFSKVRRVCRREILSGMIETLIEYVRLSIVVNTMVLILVLLL